MHQHPRRSPVSASLANSPRTNPIRTNNAREHNTGVSRPGSEKELSVEQAAGLGEDGDTFTRGHEGGGISKEALAKLAQVVQVCHELVGRVTGADQDKLQNFFTKAALTILHSRIVLPPVCSSSGTKRINKWVSMARGVSIQPKAFKFANLFVSASLMLQSMRPILYERMSLSGGIVMRLPIDRHQ